MKTFEELYYEVLVHTLKDKNTGFLSKIANHNTHHLDCLLNPKKHPLVWQTGPCDCEGDDKPCVRVCPFHAIHPNESGDIKIDETECIGCELCVQECRAHKLTAGKDVIPALQKIRSHEGLVYAMIAPAYLGQFSPKVTPGKLRNALKKIGFDGMIEVSLFADILTLKEALEFDKNITSEDDYQLTSCCCPMWIAMIRKIYHELVPHVPPAVSPMVATGRAVKLLHPDALTVFIGPCLAKKSEAREKDVADSVDFVLTFKEMEDVFNILEINPADMEESEKDHSSRAGRVYAYAGGVSEAVRWTLEKINPERKISIKTERADGVAACKTLLENIRSGKTKANFFEGMGCIGGCVGGPRVIIPHQDGKEHVERYGLLANYETPIENPYVVEMLERLGLAGIDDLLEKSDIFTRSFSADSSIV